MKIIQVNSWLGRLSGPLERFIKEQQADIVCMQETFKPQNDDDLLFPDMFGFLKEVKKAGDFTYESFAATYAFSFAGNMLELGNTIFSKFPLTNQHHVHTFQHYYILDGSASYLPNTRVFQSCMVELPDGRKLSIANYQGHLEDPKGQGSEVTVQTMRKVREELRKLPWPLVFCGDFNIWPSSPALAELNNLGLRNLTIENGIKTTLSQAHRAPEEDRQIAICDYILVSPDIKVKRFSASDEVVSDHRALILEFDI